MRLQNLTVDLYVWPNRPHGPGARSYEPDDTGTPYAYDRPYDSGESQKFALYDMWITGRDTECQAFAAYLECQARSLCIIGLSKRRLPGYFDTNPIIRAGYTAVQRMNFLFHATVSWYYGSPGPIYDSAIGFPTGYPSPFIPWTLAIGATLGDYPVALVASTPIPIFGIEFWMGVADPIHPAVDSILSSRGYAFSPP